MKLVLTSQFFVTCIYKEPLPSTEYFEVCIAFRDSDSTFALNACNIDKTIKLFSHSLNETMKRELCGCCAVGSKYPTID